MVKCVVAVLCTLILMITTLTFIEASSSSTNRYPVILISLDGLGWQLTSNKNTPNLDYLGKTGVKAKYFMKTVTPTLTSWPNHHTYVTGLYPETHGIVSNNFWDPVFKEKFVSVYDCTNFDPKFWSEAEPIWVSLEKKGIDTAVYFWPGYSSFTVKPTYYEKPVCMVNCSSIKDLPASRKPVRQTYPPYIHCISNFTIPVKTRIDSIISWLSSDKPPRFVAFYSEKPDLVGHSYGSQSSQFKDELREVDRDVIGYMISELKKANLFDKTNIIVVADHSFVTINSSNLLFLEDYLNSSTYMLSEHGAAAHVWPKEGYFDEVYDNLTKLAQKLPLGNIYKKEEIPKEWHYSSNRRIPPIIIHVGNNWAVTQNRVPLPNGWVYGMHGYPSSVDMSSIFYAHGPSFNKGQVINQGLRSIDVYPMLCDLLGIEPRPHNGSLDNMKMMLVKHTPKATGSIL